MATITLTGAEPIVRGIKNYMVLNLGDYLTAVEALPEYSGAEAITMPRLFAGNCYMNKRMSLEAAPSLFILGKESEPSEMTGSHICYMEPGGGGYMIEMEYVMWHDDPEILIRMCYRVGLAVNQMFSDNPRIGGLVDHVMVERTEFGDAFTRDANTCEQSVFFTLRAQTQEVR